MKAVFTLIVILLAMTAYCMGQDKAKQDSIINTVMQEADTIGTRKTLNEIRFNGWTKSDWLDNEYIRTLRKYLDDYNNGTVCNSTLDPYKEQIKGPFVIYDINSFLLGGALIRITFLDLPDRIFSCWITAMSMKRKRLWKAMSFVQSA